MSRNRIAAIINARSEPGNLRPLAAGFVPCPAGFFPSPSQQWIYQMAYEQRRRKWR